jgi:hypothetical protein
MRHALRSLSACNRKLIPMPRTLADICTAISSQYLARKLIPRVYAAVTLGRGCLNYTCFGDDPFAAEPLVPPPSVPDHIPELPEFPYVRALLAASAGTAIYSTMLIARSCLISRYAINKIEYCKRINNDCDYIKMPS